MAAQNIVPTASSANFPGCAVSCAVLLSAEQVCEPPTQPVTNQLTYDTCFCNSVTLAAFATTPDALCTAECTIESDRVLLQQWFEGFCAQVRAGVDPVSTQVAATTVTATTQAPQSTTTAPITLTTATIPSSTGTSPSAKSSGGNSWIDTHWKYVLMICIIIAALAALAVAAVYLKRRHRRKLEQQRAAASGFNYDPEKRTSAGPRQNATADLWGPHQAQHASQGYLYDADGVTPIGDPHRSSRRSKADRAKPDMIEVADAQGRSAISPHASGRRARPSELEMNARMIGAADRRSKSHKGSQRRKLDEQDVVSKPRSASGPRSRPRSRTRRRNSDPAQAARS